MDKLQPYTIYNKHYLQKRRKKKGGGGNNREI